MGVPLGVGFMPVILVVLSVKCIVTEVRTCGDGWPPLG